MKLGLSLFLIYGAGKGITVAIHGLELEPPTVLALLWQDVLIALAVGAAWKFCKPAGWSIYVAALLHFAFSMPLLRLMATPLTAPLLLAGGGTLADSIRHHLDFENFALIAGTLLAGVLLPRAMRNLQMRVRPALAAVILTTVAVGWFKTGSAELQGLHRNALVALAQSAAKSPVSFVGMNRSSEISGFHGVLSGANVVLIALESTGTRHLGPYGAAKDPMPFLTALAREGVVFENAYATYPESIKGLASVLGSRQPELGFREEDFRRAVNPSLASVCAASGYETALFHSGRFMYLGMDEVVAAAGFGVAEDAGAIGGNYNSSFGVDDFAAVERVLQWLDQRDSPNPFFIHYLPIAGHHPYESPVDGPFGGHDDQSRYLDALHYSDLALRKLVDGLAARGLLENTLFVIYGDHGEAFGEHPGNYGHTLYLYEENVRVPLIFRAPKLEAARIERVTSLADIAPTVCDLLGIAAPPTFGGVSAFVENERPALFVTDYSMRLYGLRFGDWKLICEKETGYVRLYDLGTDAGERTNLAGAHPEIAAMLQNRFLRWSKPNPSPTLAGEPERIAQR